MKRKKRQAPTSSGSPILTLFAAPDRSTGSDQHVIIVLLCVALCVALFDMSIFLAAAVGVVRRNKAAAAGHSGSYGFLRRILLYYRNGRFHAGNQYFVYCVRRIPCKMDGTAVRVVYT